MFNSITIDGKKILRVVSNGVVVWRIHDTIGNKSIIKEEPTLFSSHLNWGFEWIEKPDPNSKYEIIISENPVGKDYYDFMSYYFSPISNQGKVTREVIGFNRAKYKKDTKIIASGEELLGKDEYFRHGIVFTGTQTADVKEKPKYTLKVIKVG